jgi:geranylgeranylglycerol-phosphate geranylgeranyltransferase
MSRPELVSLPKAWMSTGSLAHWQQVVGMVHLIRLTNSLPAGALVLTGAHLGAGSALAPRAWIAAGAMCCITAFGYVSNDLADVAEDRINKPDRPLPSGKVEMTTAQRLAACLAAGGATLAATLGWRELLVALTVLALLMLYNGRLKAAAGGGNLLIALLAGCTLLTGAIAVQGFVWSATAAVCLPSALLAVFVAARELVKTLEDLPGDQAVGKKTLAVWGGWRLVVRVVLLCTLASGGLALLAVRMAHYSNAFLAVTGLGVVAPLGVTTLYLWRKAPVLAVRRMLRLLKLSYVAGLVALWLA